MQIRVGAREQVVVIFREASGLPCPGEDPPFTVTSNSPGVARIEQHYVVGISAGQAVLTVRTGTGRLAKTGAGAVTVSAEAPSVPSGAPSVAPAPVAPAPTPNVTPVARGPGTATLAYQPAGTAPAAGIVTTPSRMELVPGESRFLSYRTADVRGGPAEPLPLQFAIEPASALTFVTIDTIGVVTASDTGSATIRVSAVGRPNVTALPVPVVVRADSVAFSRPRVNLAPNTVDTVVMRVPSQNRDIDMRSRVYRYETTDTLVASVHLFEPVVEARAPGTATITATNPRLPPVQLAVNVFRPVTAIQLSDTALTIAIRQTRRVVMRPVADTLFVREAPTTVRGLDTTKVQARYDSTGTFTFVGRASGQTAVTMRVQNGRDSASAVERTLRIRVVAGGLQLSRSRIGLGVGERTPLAIALLDESRRPVPEVRPDVTWSTSDSSVAAYDNGQILARGVGRARITARAPVGWDSTASVDVFVGPDMLVVKQRANTWDIYGRGAGATGTWSPLTQDTLVESFPSWSPDLTRIVYVVRPAGRPRGGDLYIANANGSDATRLFGVDSATVYRPHFVGPRGERIVFELSYPSDGRSEAWTVGADGQRAQKLALGTPGTFTGSPVVSPDGQKILYVSLRPSAGPGGYDIYMANVDGTGERRVTTTPRTDDSPAWAPDGQSFFFLRDEGEVQRGRPSKRVFRFDLRADSATGVTPSGMYVATYSVSGDARTLALNIIDPAPATTTRLVLYDIAAGAQTPIALDAGELLGQASPSAWRPALPAAPAARP